MSFIEVGFCVVGVKRGNPTPVERFAYACGDGKDRSWYQKSRLLIEAIIHNYRRAPEAELRKIISRNYPFGERKHWPYKAWLRAVNDCMTEHLGPKQEELDGLFA